MEKLVYLLGPGSPPPQTPAPATALRDRLLESRSTLRAGGARACTITTRDLDDPRLGETYQNDEDGLLSATVSVWLDSLDERRPVEALLREMAPKLAGYLAAESIPREYAERDWADGERSPGVALVTAFPRPDRLDDQTFFECWHGSHTPLSLEIHPLTRYVRNTLARPLTPEAPPYRALVSESVDSLATFCDPVAFYGSKENQARAVADLARFVDFGELRTVVMSEYILIS